MAMKIFRPNRGTKTYAEEQGTVLHDGEMFFELPESGLGTGECKIKMGDGSTAYSSLPYAIDLSTRAPINHSSSDTSYGGGNSSEYGHVKLTDNYSVSGGSAADSVAASGLALYNAYTDLNNQIAEVKSDVAGLSDLSDTNKTFQHISNITDLNEFYNGVIRVSGSCLNQPEENGGGFCLAFLANGAPPPTDSETTILQIFADYRSYNIYMRAEWYGTWYSWRRISNSAL